MQFFLFLLFIALSFSLPTAFAGARDAALFLQDNVPAAFKEARRTGKPVLVQFFGRSCWICDLMEKETLGTSEFRKASDAFVRVRVNVGTAEAQEFLEQIKVQSVPQDVYFSPAGDEIGRNEGYFSLKSEVRNLKQALRDQAWPISRLRRIALSGNAEREGKRTMGQAEAAHRLAKLYSDRHEYSKAARFLVLGGQDDFALRTEIEIGQLRTGPNGWSPEFLPEDSKLLQQLVELEEGRVQKYPLRPESLDWRLDLAKLYGMTAQKGSETRVLYDLLDVLKNNFRAAGWWVHEGVDASIAEDYEGKVYELLGNPAEAKKCYEKAIQKFRARIDSESGPARDGLLDHLASEYRFRR